MDMTRRTLRALRASQPQSILNHHPSLSSHVDRATRSSLRPEYLEKLLRPNSSSILKTNESTIRKEETTTMQTRRKRGRAEEQRDKSLKIQESQVYNSSRSDQVSEDDEIVRCICGLDDYPGPPKCEGEVNLEIQELIETPVSSVSDIAEDLAGFFLQCDVCKVWQHGGCVGIKNEGSSPDEYFCERCRKDLHKIFTALDGQRYSHYLPLHQSLPCSASRSILPLKEEIQSPKDNKAGRPQIFHHANSKRRSTMNSRDAAYDEEEQIRRAIEASKDVNIIENADGCLRRGKRGRSNSEEKLQDSKRQRTKSASPSSQESNQVPSQPESDDGVNGRMVSGKKTRSTSSKTSKEKDLQDERENLRYDAAAKRNGRAERRKFDDPEIKKEASFGNRNLAGDGIDYSNTSTLIESLESQTTSSGRVSDNLLANQPPLSVKKCSRNLNSRKGKLGKNQYTKERDQQVYEDQQPHRPQSRDTIKIDDTQHINANRGFSSEPKVGKFKGNFSKVTMTDMKRRVAVILDFISRTQLEMASESIYHAPGDSIRDLVQGSTDDLPIFRSSCDKLSHTNRREQSEESPNSSKEFRDLSCRDMMDVLTKQLIKWQKDFLQ